MPLRRRHLVEPVAVSVVRVGLAALPVINLMRDALLESDLIYGDETTFQVLKEPGRRPQTKSYIWAQMNGSGPPIRLFTYTPGCDAKHAAQLYADINPRAALMTDGYELYSGIAHTHQLVHLGYRLTRGVRSSRPTTRCPKRPARQTCWRRASST